MVTEVSFFTNSTLSDLHAQNLDVWLPTRCVACPKSAQYEDINSEPQKFPQRPRTLETNYCLKFHNAHFKFSLAFSSRTRKWCVRSLPGVSAPTSWSDRSTSSKNRSSPSRGSPNPLYWLTWRRWGLHTYMHTTHTHTCTTHTHAHTPHTHTHTCTTHTHTCTTHTHTQYNGWPDRGKAYTHTCTHTHTCTTHTHKQYNGWPDRGKAYTHTCTHTHAPHTHTQFNGWPDRGKAYMHTCTHTHMHHTHMHHTHTHNIMADLTEVRLTCIHAHTHMHHTHTIYIMADLTEVRLARIHAHHTYTHTIIVSGRSADLGLYCCKHAHWIVFEELNYFSSLD